MSPQILPLQLNEGQTQEISQLQDELGKKLEQYGSLRPEMLADLTAAMASILTTQKGFSALATKARDQQQMLHLTHADPSILNLPWRLAIQEYPLLFLTKGKPCIGDLPVLVADNPPLKILVMIASPEDAAYEARLNYEDEEDQIIRAFEPLFDSGQVQIDFTDDGSLDNLTEKLRENRYHIVHFSGHGIEKDGKGYLALEDPQTMYQQLVTADAFAQVFQQKPEHLPALVVLSSCQTAKGGLEEGMQSVADELLLKGLPAVVAMSVSVTDYFATFFASQLYQQLSYKEPLYRAFQKAITQTRQHEQKKYPNLLPSQWMIPQLLLSQQVAQPVDFSKADQNLTYAAWKFVSGQQGVQQQKRTGYRFIGRRRDRKRIFQQWQQRNAILLKGQGGVGKTAMAEYILQRLVASNPSIHPFIFNEITASLNEVITALERFLKTKRKRKRVLEIKNDHQNNAYKQFEYLFAEVEQLCQPLFIFDNLESFQTLPGEAFRTEFAEGLAKLIVFFYEEELPLLLTCRYSVAECPDIPSIDLNQVGRNDFLKKALQLPLKDLPKKIQRQGLAHLVAERLTFREVIDWLRETFGGNYRALEFFAELFIQKKNQLPDALKSLADFKDQYATATLETRQHMSKNLLFAKLLELLSVEEKTTLRLLSHFRIPVVVTALQMQQADLDYLPLLDSLKELTLLEKHRDPEQTVLQYYYVTPLVKDLVQEILSSTSPLDFSPESAGKYHYYFIQEINPLRYIELEEAFHFFMQTSNTFIINEVSLLLSNFYYSFHLLQKSANIGLLVYEKIKNKASYKLLNKVAMALQIIGNIEKSIYFFNISLNLSIIAKDRNIQCAILNNIGTLYCFTGEHDDSLRYHKDSIKICLEIKDKDMEVANLNNIGRVHLQLGNYTKALSTFENVLTQSKFLNNKLCQAKVLNNIGEIHRLTGKFTYALQYYQKALNISLEINDKICLGDSYNNIGLIYCELNKPKKALRHLNEAYKISKEIEDKSLESNTLNNLGQLEDKYNNPQKALKLYSSALDIQREIKDKGGEGISLLNIGVVKLKLKKYKEAKEHLDKALIIQKNIGDKSGEAYTLHHLALVALEKGEHEKYLEHEKSCYKISKDIGDDFSVCMTGLELGLFLCRNMSIKEGMPFLQNSLKASRKIGEKSFEKKILNHIGIIYYEVSGEYMIALEYLQQSLKISQDIGDINGVAVTLTNIGAMHFDIGAMHFEQEQYQESVPLLMQAYTIFKKISSPNINAAAGYLGAIIEKVGEEQFKAWLHSNQASNSLEKPQS